MAKGSSPLSLALACLLCLAQALRPSAYSATRAAPLRPSAVVSRRQLVAAAAAVSSLPLPPASAAPNKNVKAKKTLKPELVAILLGIPPRTYAYIGAIMGWSFVDTTYQFRNFGWTGCANCTGPFPFAVGSFMAVSSRLAAAVTSGTRRANIRYRGTCSMIGL